MEFCVVGNLSNSKRHRRVREHSPESSSPGQSVKQALSSTSKPMEPLGASSWTEDQGHHTVTMTMGYGPSVFPDRSFNPQNTLSSVLDGSNKTVDDSVKQVEEGKDESPQPENRTSSGVDDITYDHSSHSLSPALSPSQTVLMKMNDSGGSARARPVPTCKTCSLSFPDSYQLRVHARTHSGEKPYRCPECGKSFSRNTTLREHTKRIHGGEKPFNCAMCGKFFSKKASLVDHIRTHTGEKPYVCATCGKAYSGQSALKDHLKIHSVGEGEKKKSFPCTFCGKEFIRLLHLQIHTRSHTGERPFVCAVCGKAFSDCSTLKRHIRTHTGEELYKCPTCGRNYSARSHLQRHMNRTHAMTIGDSDSPCFECVACLRTFHDALSLLEHAKIHTAQHKPFECSVCGQTFPTVANLKSHFVAMHAEEEEEEKDDNVNLMNSFDYGSPPSPATTTTSIMMTTS